ncbi:hypothetical protein EBB07_18250 [Paenibacillaceae bacterium]|nr:hypothetical protein EBB07_18250 [Paenibacillaceae bacterium]
MNGKTAVYLYPYEKTRYAYQKLYICRSCGQFSVLRDETCAGCGKSKLTPIEQRAGFLVKRTMWMEHIIGLLILLFAVVFSPNEEWIALSAAGGLLLLLLLLASQRKSVTAKKRKMLIKLIERDPALLRGGLIQDREDAIAVFHDGDKPLAYEMLREIGMLMQTDQLRIEQILLLQSFILRKDMDLMLQPLLMRRFDPDLVAYIGELAKIRRDLLKESAFRYVLVFETQILEMAGGAQILTNVAGAAVRKKRYITLYPHLVMRYARKLPRDRFLRLYDVIRLYPQQDFGELADEVYTIYNERYRNQGSY